jgi:uncharacterized protein
MMRWVTGTIVLAVIAAAIVVGLGAEGKGCEKSGGDVQSVKIGGKWFHLEVAATDAVRMKGLGQRDHIDADGGMLFVFAQAINPTNGGFVMRDCPIDIDIIYLNPEGRVGSMYQMKAEPPRGPDEGKIGDFGQTPESAKYEQRLKKYQSRYPMQFVIELKGGTLPGLSIKEGDKIDLPYADLKKRAE